MSLQRCFFEYGPIIGTTTMFLAALAVLLLGRRHGRALSARTLLPAAYLGLHALVGGLLFVGHRFALPRGDVHLVTSLLDLVGLVVLVLAIVDMDHVARGVRRDLERSRSEAAEYERARRDYETLMRHRIANPLAVVSGGIGTLADHGERMDPGTRKLLLDEMAAALERLELVETLPSPRSVEERDLDGIARIAPALPAA
jgi:signal transduction histidine kinase